MGTRQVVRRKESFDTVAKLYDSARPGYPPLLIQDLIRMGGVEEGRRVLEIGPGAGQLTVPLAESSVTLVAVELGANLAEIVRRKLAPFPHAEVLNADFDTWTLPAEPFDLVVAATAFHWLDPATRLQRCVDALRLDGMLAIVETHWGIGISDDPFFAASQACFARWDPDHDPTFRPYTIADLPNEREDLVSSDRFAQITNRRYVAEREFSAAQYCDLLGTFSNILGFEEAARKGFLACIRALIEDRFDGKVVQHDVFDLWLALTRSGQT